MDAGLPLVLASRSPQRRAILERLGVAFSVRPTDVPELDRGEPAAVAVENALRKARAALRAGAGARTLTGTGTHMGTREAVLGVDTLVSLDGRIYGKPLDLEQAATTLRALSGATHQVIGGIALILPECTRTAAAVTSVTFRELDETVLTWYLSLNEWRERAGGYAIQGAGAALISHIQGDYENVVGLPLAALLELYPQLLPAGVRKVP
jgi:septum formation protein